MDIIERARTDEKLANGVSARGSLALYRASQIYAAMRGRDYVIPEDVRTEALCVLPHRVILVSSSHNDPARFIENLLEELEVPLEKP
jgi:MoxR-like ATPase